MDEQDAEIEQLIAVLELLERVEFTEFRFEGNAISILMRRGATGAATPDEGLERAQPPSGARDAAQLPAAEAATDGTFPITAPFVGHFYRAPAPGACPFVELGDRVQPESVVCIVEVMKLTHGVQAGVAGVVCQICAANGDAVEFGQVLFRIRPEEDL